VARARGYVRITDIYIKKKKDEKEMTFYDPNS
jgi:hypothetical protein